MSVEELRQELLALKARVHADKEAMDQLKNENDSLLQRLDSKGEAASSHTTKELSPSLGASGESLPASARERIVYLPKEKKCPVFTGGSSAAYYDWLDEMNAALVYRSYAGAEKAAYIYEHLGGEARQEIKFRPQTERSNPIRVLEILKEIYGQPQSLTKLQKQFFDRRQREGESVREYSHALMAIMEEINHCKVKEAWCGDFALRDQFAENVSETSLRRELKKTIRQQPTMSFFDLRKEALQWGEEAEFGADRKKRVIGSCDNIEAAAVESSVVTSAVDAKPEPMLAKVFDMLQKQQALIDDLSQKLSTNMQTSAPSGRKWEPRYDASGQPICFKCQKAGHIARFCATPRTSRVQGNFPSLPTLPPVSDGAVQISEQQGNSLPPR